MIIMKYISFFESLTGSKLKDCISENNQIIFVVEQNEIGRAIGKKGSNVKRIERALKKRIRIIEFNPDLLTFVRNAVHPLKARDIVEDDGIVTITAVDSQTRGYLIGRNASNLRAYEAIIKRYFEIKELKVA